MQVDFNQYAVRKGGFHSYHLWNECSHPALPVYSYIFDCGGTSRQLKRSLDELIAENGTSPHFKFFALSHWDQDHYSGVRFFKDKKITFDALVIPVFGVIELLAALLHDSTHAELFNYLHENRAKVIIATADPSLATSEEQPNEGDDFPGKIVKLDDRPKELIRHGIPDWKIHFFFAKSFRQPHPLSKKLAEACESFRQAILDFDFRKMLEIKTKIKKSSVLRRELSGFDFNHHGLCMHSFSTTQFKVQVNDPAFTESKTNEIRQLLFIDHPVSFMQLGDVTLKGSSGRVIQQKLRPHSFEFIQVPHHGSPLNHDEGFYQNLRSAQCFLGIQGFHASAHHPSPKLRKQLETYGRVLFSATQPKTRYKIISS